MMMMIENDYLQPTIFYKRQRLEELWAHLGEECDEALEIAIPGISQGGVKLDKKKSTALAMELVDVQTRGLPAGR